MKKTNRNQDKVQNIYKVPVKAWRKWCVTARATFNSTYDYMREGVLFPELFNQLSNNTKRVVAWNAAWLAADNMNHVIRSIAARLFPEE